MGKINVLIEVKREQPEAFGMFEAAMDSEIESLRQGEDIVSSLSGMGVDVLGSYPPVPMFPEEMVRKGEAFLESVTDRPSTRKPSGFAAFDSPETHRDMAAESVVVAAEVERSAIEKLQKKRNVTIYPNSPLSLFCCEHAHAQFESQSAASATASAAASDIGIHPFDLARSSGGTDCRPFRQAVSIETIRTLLGVQRAWDDGFRGQNIVVGIIDEGVNGQSYPVIDGFRGPNVGLPGSSSILSHGSMCAADILVAAPAAKLYDYPFLGNQNSGGALAMFQSVLDRRRIDGTPHITNNSYGWTGRPRREDFPTHEIYDLNHPIHRKVREVVASGCPSFFAAGNCGEDCPSSNCRASGIGPGISITASNCLTEVITVAAVNSLNDRIGYSSQGPGNFEDGFERNKPDISSYSHFFGNFGPGRPGGIGDQPFDSGTSAATPVAAGVGALLMSAFPELTPQRLKNALIRGAVNIGAPGWDADTGFGVINAAASYMLLRSGSL